MRCGLRCAIAEIGLAIMQDTVQRVYRTDAPRVVILKGPGSKRAGGGGGPRDASGGAFPSLYFVHPPS